MILVSRNAAASSGEALLSVVVTLLVFYAAHAYASAMSWLASGQGERRTLGEALRRGASDSVGMVVVGAVPIVILALGVIGIVREANAVWLALGTDMLLLGLLGWFVAVTRTGNIWMRLGSALITAAFGGILIALKALVHH
ncbi:hypothetical protein DC31_02535 [Microbacterium sp. CH12i]|uniref:hypothetical protein n=1 Tax=Microbacterium sp. CH12i TaxID=1479651 RepID=UPI0004618845|nr:hypothetical protein [Microbacterium sp. CH12i]KDA04947.1 hypothetical protein DC31_02535 [Microbacterium sp. CH12i]